MGKYNYIFTNTGGVFYVQLYCQWGQHKFYAVSISAQKFLIICANKQLNGYTINLVVSKVNQFCLKEIFSPKCKGHVRIIDDPTTHTYTIN